MYKFSLQFVGAIYSCVQVNCNELRIILGGTGVETNFFKYNATRLHRVELYKVQRYTVQSLFIKNFYLSLVNMLPFLTKYFDKSAVCLHPYLKRWTNCNELKPSISNLGSVGHGINVKVVRSHSRRITIP